MKHSGGSHSHQELMPYLKRSRLVRHLNFMRLVLLLSLPAALINGITGFEDPAPLLFFVAPVTALLISFLLPAPEPVNRLDRACSAEGEILTWAEFAREPQKGPYGEILTARVNRRLEKNSPVKVFPLPRFFVLSLFILTLLLSFSLLFPGFFTARRNLIQDKLDQLDRRFAEAAENDPRFAPLAEKFKEMEKEYFPQKESSPVNKDWEELSKDLTEQIRELERNRLSELFEDQGEKKAQGLAELSRGEMAPGEIRNFILELMSDPGLDGDVSDSLARSYRDYSEDSGEEQQRQKDLARNLMDQVDPENRENRRELQNLAEELSALAEGPGPEEESSGEGEEFREERESRQIGGSSGTEGPSRAEETGEATTAAGSRADPGDKAGSDFNPHQGDRPEVQLPEGPVLERGDRGIIRLEGEEKIRLERTSSEKETGAPLLEEATGQEEIPPRFRDLVRDYFITIGTGTP